MGASKSCHYKITSLKSHSWALLPIYIKMCLNEFHDTLTGDVMDVVQDHINIVHLQLAHLIDQVQAPAAPAPKLIDISKTALLRRLSRYG